MATSLIMATTSQAGDTATRSITHIDPTATNAELKDFAESINGLTTNTLSDARRVDTTSLIKDTKLERNLQLSSSTISASTISTNIETPTKITLTGAAVDGNDLLMQKIQNEDADYCYVDWINVIGEPNKVIIAIVADSTVVAGSEIIFSLPESGVYQAAAVTLSIG